MPELQLDLFAPPPPPPKPTGPDAFTQRLIDTGLWSGSTWLLENNRTLDNWKLDRTSWGKWNYPSRAFKFPIEYFGPGRFKDEDEACLALNHPDLSEHPWVKIVEEALGESIPWLPKDEFGRDRGERWRYFHALDLATDDLFLCLIDECNFTDEAAAAAGVGYGVRYGALSPGHGRTVLTFFGHEEPEDRSAAALEARIINPSPMFLDDNGNPTKTPRYGMNDGGWHQGASAFTSADRCWAFIHGLEDGYFKFPRQRARKDGHGGVGFITMTPEGLERMGFDHEAKEPEERPMIDLAAANAEIEATDDDGLKDFTIEFEWWNPVVVHQTIRAASVEDALAQAKQMLADGDIEYDRQKDCSDACTDTDISGLWEASECYVGPDVRPPEEKRRQERELARRFDETVPEL